MTDMIDVNVKKNYDYRVAASGRVNIIGEHVDYCGGKVFPAALSLKNDIYLRPNGTDKINIKWTTLPDEISLDISKLDSYRGLKYGNYQAGSLFCYQREGGKITGCDMLYDCHVPFGSGLSSSAAIEVSTIAAMKVLSGEPLDDKPSIALTAQRAEREYAGVNCGIMDQYASACGVKGHAMLLDCVTLDCRQVPFNLGDYSLIIINTNKQHTLSASAYNERRRETEEALSILSKKTGAKTLADISPEEFLKFKHLLNPVLRKRAEHVIFECERVKLASEAMENGDIKKLGALLNESHDSLRNLYDVTGPELDCLVSLARQQDVCVGSRMTGAGFGGCAISIVAKGYEKKFIGYIINGYEKEIGYKPTAYDVFIDDGIVFEKL